MNELYITMLIKLFIKQCHLLIFNIYITIFQMIDRLAILCYEAANEDKSDREDNNDEMDWDDSK